MFKRSINRSLGEMEPLLGPDLLAEALRGLIREVILTLTDAGLSKVLAALPYQGNNDRRGYRNGSVDYPAIQSTADQVRAYL